MELRSTDSRRAPAGARGHGPGGRAGLLARLVSLGTSALPESWERRWETASRDAQWVRRRLTGEAPRPYTEFARRARTGADGVGARMDKLREERADRVAPRGVEGPCTVTVVHDGRTHLAVARPGETVLEAGLAAGAELAFSCAVGGCGTCRLKLVSGEVEMSEPNCLSEVERRAGYVLACVARPLGPVRVESA